MTGAKTNYKGSLSAKHGDGEMVKPAELIEIQGASSLTLNDRRVFNLLLRNAFGPELGDRGSEFTIDLNELRSTEDGNSRLIASIEALMKTLVVYTRQDGSVDRAQLLGPNNMSAPGRERGLLRYSIPDKLADALRDSEVFAILEMEVMKAFTSKYALALYEVVAKRINLTYKATEVFDLETFRELLGVPPGKLATYGNLNHNAIKPALLEVNALTEFDVTITPQRKSRHVVGFAVGWNRKDIEGRKLVYEELRRSKVGRKARVEGTVIDTFTD